MKIKSKYNEIAMLIIVIVISIFANLSDNNFIGSMVSHKTLLIVLTGTIVIALFHYLRLMLFVTIIILAIGANLPEELAASMGISVFAMMASLVFLISVSAANYLFKLLPTGIEQTPAKINTADSRKSVLTAVSQGDLVNLHRMLKYNTELNFSEDGAMPVFIAAEKGYTDVMQILVHAGVEFNVKNSDGKTPMDIALAKGYTRIAEILYNAERSANKIDFVL